MGPLIAIVALGAGALALLKASNAQARNMTPTGLVPVGKLSSPFGPRGPEGVHAGIDIAAARGSEIRAAAPGVVVDTSPDGSRTGYGNVVIVEHPNLNGVLTLYAHMDHFAPGVAVGDHVEDGTVLGYVGSTHLPMSPTSMGAHLHFEVHRRKVLTKEGRIIVNPSTPPRINPVVWLAQIHHPIADIARPADVA
jgi:murein DD-endopeptidase MepM/ murein hydrolase activator NlpD